MITMLAAVGAIELGLVYGILALAIFISFRILNIPDLTVDGSFVTGGAVCAMFTVGGMPYLGLVGSFLAGCVAGLITGLLHTKLKIQPILSGIITMIGLYSINLRIMAGKANVSLGRDRTLFTDLEQIFGIHHRLIVLLLFALLIALVLVIFLNTKMGLSLRATGDNESMVKSSSINADFTKVLGLSLANGIVGLSSGLLVQYQKFCDINMGTGMMVIALASLIIGEVIFGRRNLTNNIVSALLGSVVYRLIIAFVLAQGLAASDLKLLSALVVVVAIYIPGAKSDYTFRKVVRENKRQVMRDAEDQ